MSASPAPSCARCGDPLPEKAVFCPACGTRVSGGRETFSRYPPVFAFATEHARRRFAQAARGLSARVRALAETAAIRSRAQSDLNRLRYARLEALERRGSLLAELGTAVYDNNAEATERLRGEIAKLDERITATEAQMQKLAAEAADRVRKAALPVQDTEIANDRTGGSSD